MTATAEPSPLYVIGEEEILRGAHLLDEKVPFWAAGIGIDLSTFNIMNPFNCILGQLFGGYCTGLKALDLWDAPGASYDYGFCPRKADHAAQYYRIWSEQIRRRRILRSEVELG